MMKLATLVLMVLAAAFSRLIPHPWNFTAIGAMALFGGAYFPSRKQSLLIPLFSLFLSDLVLGFHSTMVYVYLAVAIIGVMGWALRKERSAVQVGTLSLVSSLLFFVVSNFGVWAVEGFYAPTLQGLVDCYVAALPFLDNQIYGDMFFSAALFGGYEALKHLVPELVVSSDKI